jgi:polyadenylation factor subunit 2
LFLLNIKNRIWQRDFRDSRAIQADVLYTQSLTLPQDMMDNPVNCIMTKFIRAALNKDPRPVFCVCECFFPSKSLLVLFFNKVILI